MTMSAEDRYVVKLASGAWVSDDGPPTRNLKLAYKAARSDAYRVAAANNGVALRLKPSPRAAELAKLRAEVEELRGLHDAYRADTARDALNLKLAREERDALATQLAALPPDVTDEELAQAMYLTSAGGLAMAKVARRLLRGPVAPARPVDELADDLYETWSSDDAAGNNGVWNAVAKRARELGAR